MFPATPRCTSWPQDVYSGARPATNRGSASVSAVTGAIVACLGRLLADSSPARALDPNLSLHPYIHTVWTTEDGLPQNAISAIVQTHDGYLWLGTFGGLARFDGITFTVFTAANSEGLKDNRILALIVFCPVRKRRNISSSGS